MHLPVNLLAMILQRGAGHIARRFLRRDPAAEQDVIFHELIRAGAATRFGRDHGFAALRDLPFEQSYDRFRQNVPVRSYSDFWQEYFAPCWRDDGDQRRLVLENVTWPGTIPLFCETSGTTAPTKYIPFSREMFRANQRAARDLVACYLDRTPTSRLLTGRFLYMAGSTELTPLGDDIWSGDMSAITLHQAPSWLRPLVAPPSDVSALPWEERLAAMTQLLLDDRQFTGISGVPPWILMLLQRCREEGKAPLAELLPNLELIIHGGTSMAPYRQEFDQLFGDRPPTFLEVLPSSEGFIGFQLPGETDLRLTPYYGVFFEFVPFRQLDGQGRPAPGAEFVPLAEVRAGERYSVILSTCAGLWRYLLGDTVRFTSVAPLSFVFTGRDRCLERFEEKVTQEEVEQAVAELPALPGEQANEFLVGPDIPGRRHLWVLGVSGPTLPPERLAHLLDDALRRRNADYAAFRAQGRINSPRVVTVGEAVIYAWSREVRGKLGGQSKIPRIDPTPTGELVASLAEFAAHQPHIGTKSLPHLHATAPQRT